MHTTKPPGEIALNALAGINSLSTIRMSGTIKNHKIHILVNSGSTHSFINTELVEKLKLIAHEILGVPFCTDLRPFPLGGVDVILGFDWLKLYNPITFDYNQYKILIHKEGQPVTLQGTFSKANLQEIGSKEMSKLLKSKGGISQGCICVVNAIPIVDNNSKVPNIPILQLLLNKYQVIFSEPQGYLQRELVTT